MTCPECNGTGKYVGLTVVEDCKACQAEKYIHRIRTDGPMVINLSDLMQRGKIISFREAMNIVYGEELLK